MIDNRRKHNIDQNFFKTWTHDMAYCLGFISADGNVYNSTVSITCHDKDVEVLNYFKNLIGKSTPIESRKNRDEIRVRFNSVEMVRDLNSLGIYPNKSLSIKFPNSLPREFLGSYTRGVFDGDGWVGITDKKDMLNSEIYSGSEDFMKSLRLKWNNIGSFYSKIGKREKDKNPLYIWHMGKRDSVKFRDYIYLDNGFSLERKKNIFYSKEFDVSKCQKFWTEKEINFLIGSEDMTTKEIANKLKRTEVSIRKKKKRIQLLDDKG